MSREEERLKEQEEKNWQSQTGKVPGAFMLAQDKPAEQHPREILVQDINDQEQRLLDKLHALREVRLEICALSRDEAKRLLNITRLMQRVTYP